jgi:hypothetical protein
LSSIIKEGCEKWGLKHEVVFNKGYRDPYKQYLLKITNPKPSPEVKFTPAFVKDTEDSQEEVVGKRNTISRQSMSQVSQEKKSQIKELYSSGHKVEQDEECNFVIPGSPEYIGNEYEPTSVGQSPPRQNDEADDFRNAFREHVAQNDEQVEPVQEQASE